MKKKTTNLWMLAAVLAASTSVASAQITETFGTPTGTPTVAAYEAANGFDVDALTYSGSGTDIRTTNPSHTGAGGYAGASGSGNVLIQPQETFVIELINTSDCSTSDSLIFGVYKTTNASNGSELKVQYESAPGVWTNMTFAALPTGSGTSGSGSTSKWYRRAAALPSGALSTQMRFRFINTQAGGPADNPQFRIDDFKLGCGLPFSCDQIAAPVLVSDSDSIFCDGGSVILSTDAITGGQYTFYQVINGVATVIAGPGEDAGVEVTGSGTYYVVQDVDGCVSSSNLIWLHAYDSPNVGISVSPAGIVAPSTTVTATATLTNATLFFSQYVEGSNFNKYLEIYNGTGAAVNLANYHVKAFHNGVPFVSGPTFDIHLTGTLANGAVYVIAHNMATAFTGTIDLSTPDLQFNGDDALVLVDTTVTDSIKDIFGSVGNDPGAQWLGDFGGVLKGTENRTFIRKPCVYEGISINPGLPGHFGFPTLALEWDTVAVDTSNNVVDLGSHTSSIDYTWAGTNGSFVGGDNTGASVDFTVGQQGSSDLTATVTGLCDFNNCTETGGTTTIEIGQGRVTMIQNGVPAINAAAYPNPFNTSVNISIEAAEAGMVKVEVLDMYGQVVALVANTKVAAGKSNFVFDGSALNNGTYIARITTGSEVHTVRLVKNK
jgi:hypothetical protein